MKDHKRKLVATLGHKSEIDHDGGGLVGFYHSKGE